MRIDLGAEKMIAATKGLEKIAVEVKSFIQSSVVCDFLTALGQYMNYLIGLRKQEPDRVLYLAILLITYETFFQRPFVQTVIERKGMRLIIYQPSKEKIIKWIP